MTIDNLIEFIDRHTNNNAIYPNEPRSKDIEIKNGVTIVNVFSSRDWWALRGLNLMERSNSWVKCLIDILDNAYTEEARQTIIHIALTGTEENFLDAMECIRRFRRHISIYTWLKLQNRSTKISSKRLKNKPNNY